MGSSHKTVSGLAILWLACYPAAHGAAKPALVLDHLECSLRKYDTGGLKGLEANTQSYRTWNESPGTTNFQFDFQRGTVGDRYYTVKGSMTIQAPQRVEFEKAGERIPIKATASAAWDVTKIWVTQNYPSLKVQAAGDSAEKISPEILREGKVEFNNLTVNGTFGSVNNDVRVTFETLTGFAGKACYSWDCCCGQATDLKVVAVYKFEAPRPQITAAPAPLQFTADAEHDRPPAQQLQITNTGGGKLDWSASASTDSGGSWLKLEGANTGSLNENEAARVNVSVDTTNFEPGEIYEGTIRVDGNAPNSPMSIKVSAEYLQDVTVDHVEVVQVVQDTANAIPLIAGKRAVARLFVKLDPKTKRPVEGLRAELRSPAGTLRPWNANFSAPPAFDRGNVEHSLNFELTAAWNRRGPLEFEAEVFPAAGKKDAKPDNNKQTVAVKFLDNPAGDRKFKIAYLPVCYQPPGAAVKRCPDGNAEVLADILRRLYPLPDDGVTLTKLETMEYVVTFEVDGQQSLVRITSDLLQYFLLANRARPGSVDQLVGWFRGEAYKNGKMFSGQSEPLWIAGTGHVVTIVDNHSMAWPPADPATGGHTGARAADPNLSAVTVPHEIGHNLGLYHPGNPEDCGARCGDKCDWPKDANGQVLPSTIGEFGFDPVAREVKSRGLRDMMSYCYPPAKNQWISPFHYKKLIASGFQPSTGEEVPAPATASAKAVRRKAAQPPRAPPTSS